MSVKKLKLPTCVLVKLRKFVFVAIALIATKFEHKLKRSNDILQYNPRKIFIYTAGDWLATTA